MAVIDAPQPCPRCSDARWICEAHPIQPWPHDNCAGQEPASSYSSAVDRARADWRRLYPLAMRNASSSRIRIPSFCLGLALVLAACDAKSSNTPPQASGPERPTRARAIDCPLQSAGNLKYEAEFTPGSAKNPVDMLTVTFRGRKPSSADAEGVLRNCISAAKTAVRIDYETLVNAFFNDDGPLPLIDGSSSLAYDPKAAKVQTWNEREGVKPTRAKGDGYTVEYEEQKVLVPPYGKFASLGVLFQRPPKQPDAILKILTAEVEKAVSKQHTKLDTTAYAKTGPVSDPAGQKQVRGPKGVYLRAEFDAKTREIRDQDGVLLGTIK